MKGCSTQVRAGPRRCREALCLYPCSLTCSGIGPGCVEEVAGKLPRDTSWPPRPLLPLLCAPWGSSPCAPGPCGRGSDAWLLLASQSSIRLQADVTIWGQLDPEEGRPQPRVTQLVRTDSCPRPGPCPLLTACYPGQTRGKTGNLKTKEEASQRCRVGVAERSPLGGPCRGSMLPGPPFSRTLYQLPQSLPFLSQPQPGPCHQPAAALAVAPSHSLPALVSTPGNRDCLHFTGRKAE